jgi:hypothetical protein
MLYLKNLCLLNYRRGVLSLVTALLTDLEMIYSTSGIFPTYTCAILKIYMTSLPGLRPLVIHLEWIGLKCCYHDQWDLGVLEQPGPGYLITLQARL